MAEQYVAEVPRQNGRGLGLADAEDDSGNDEADRLVSPLL